MIDAIGRYVSLAGFGAAVLLHIAGYIYLDFPYPAFVSLGVGVLLLTPLAFRRPFLNRQTPIDTTAKKVASRAAAIGFALWKLTTFILYGFVQAPDAPVGPHRLPVSGVWPVWKVSARSYRMLFQQWETLAYAVGYLFYWLQFSTEKSGNEGLES